MEPETLPRSDQIKNNKMGEACGTYGGGDVDRVLLRKMEGKRQLR